MGLLRGTGDGVGHSPIPWMDEAREGMRTGREGDFCWLVTVDETCLPEA